MTGVPELEAVSDLIGSATVDGVPVLFAPSEGPVSGGLVFRVGWADEPLARRGITHLVEHLALFGLNLSDLHHNGATDEWATQFHATGSVAEVVDFLNGVCAALREPPLDRMEAEKGVLAAEAARRGGHVTEPLRIERHGVRGPGAAAYEGFGLPAVSADGLASWIGERFTRGNAVAWITSDGVPEGLDLRLPEGERRPVPEVPDLLDEKPAYFVGGAGVIVLDAVIPADTAGAVFSRVASRALFRALRQEGGLSYDARCDWERLDAERARITVFADALPEKQSEAVGEVIDVLAALRAGRVDQAELDAALASMDDVRGIPALGAQLLPSVAYKVAAGFEVRSLDRRADELAAVTVAEVVEVARRVWADAVVQIPEGDLDWAGLVRTPLWSDGSVEGTTYPRIGSEHGALVIGADGVTVQDAHGVVTVRFAEVEALETWPDGARRLVGADGFQIVVEPTLHEGLTPEVIASVDAAVAGDRHVPRAARTADDIPAPPEPGAADDVMPRGAEQRPGDPSARRGWMFYLGVAVGLFALGLAGLVIVDVFELLRSGGDGDADSVLGGVIITAIPALLAAVLLLADSRRRAKRRGGSG